jgi:flagellar motor protein MotB
VAYIYNIRHDGPRVGRSQGVLIFWGLVSAVFAALFCYYFLKDHENEAAADKYRNDVMTLQEQRDTLSAERDKLQASIDDAKSHEDFLDQKEAALAAEEARLGVLAQQAQDPTGQLQAEAATVKKFGDAIRQLATDEDSDVVVRGGHPVLRISTTTFFAAGDATLKPEGKAALSQLTQALSGQEANFELRIETFTDAGAEAQTSPVSQKKPGASGTNPADAVAWDLTAARAVAITRFFHDQNALPFANVLVIARGDTEPIVTKAKADHARNRRLEITLAPVPGALPSSDAVTADATAKTDK